MRIRRPDGGGCVSNAAHALLHRIGERNVARARHYAISTADQMVSMGDPCLCSPSWTGIHILDRLGTGYSPWLSRRTKKVVHRLLMKADCCWNTTFDSGGVRGPVPGDNYQITIGPRTAEKDAQ